MPDSRTNRAGEADESSHVSRVRLADDNIGRSEADGVALVGGAV